MKLYHDQPAGTVDRARSLRRDASTPERRLLRALRTAFPHLKWRHQAPIGPFYADMLCFSEKLVIEVDGDTHAAADDARRDAVIAREGFRTLRVTNTDVMENLDGVLTHISLSLREREGAAQPRKGEGDPTTRKGATA
ncbi:endonuclease domain-containing protein [Sphingomonas adhaesiva]|uniref:endonuclease domain-containing protein n=1 Tax=Sphingomonas adhaesiva TaxID=28212 RepID=UPI002FFD0CAA